MIGHDYLNEGEDYESYDALDVMELDIDMEIQAWGSKELLESFVKGKNPKIIDKQLLINNLNERVLTNEDKHECLTIIKNELGIVLTKQEIDEALNGQKLAA